MVYDNHRPRLGINVGVYNPPNSSKKEQRALRLLASQYFLNGGVLFKRHYNGLHLRCITQEEAKTTMDQIHFGACGTDMNGKMLATKIIKLGYYWTTMETDCIQFVKHCDICQKYANAQHIPPSLLHTMASPSYHRKNHST